MPYVHQGSMVKRVHTVLENVGFALTAIWGVIILFILLPLGGLLDKREEGHKELKKDFMAALGVMSFIMILMLIGHMVFVYVPVNHYESAGKVSMPVPQAERQIGVPSITPVVQTSDGFTITLAPSEELTASIREQLIAVTKEAAKNLPDINSPVEVKFLFLNDNGEQCHYVARLTNKTPFVITSFKAVLELFDKPAEEKDQKLVDTVTKTYKDQYIEPNASFEYHMKFGSKDYYKSGLTKVVEVQMEWRK